MRNGSKSDGIVTKDEFEEYYNNVSASIDRDDYFTLMMTNAWNLDGSRVTKAGWGNKEEGGKSAAQAGASRGGQRNAAPAKAAEAGVPANLSEKQLLEHFRTKLAARGARGIAGLGRQFKIADDDNSRALNMEEFKKAVHDFRIGLSGPDSEKLFRVFDRSNDGQIDYEEFLRGVRG